jgi:hypothetical protein
MDLLRNRKLISIILLIGITSSIALGASVYSSSYEKYKVLSNGTEKVYEECKCYGSIYVQDSYPQQYNCQGYEMCKSVNYTRKGK